jgi:hypothetical protein
MSLPRRSCLDEGTLRIGNLEDAHSFFIPSLTSVVFSSFSPPLPFCPDISFPVCSFPYFPSLSSHAVCPFRRSFFFKAFISFSFIPFWLFRLFASFPSPFRHFTPSLPSLFCPVLSCLQVPYLGPKRSSRELVL